MKILKIFGVVVAVHAAVFMFVFAIPGCRTTSHSAPPAPTADSDSSTPTVSYPGSSPVAATSSDASPSQGGAELNAGATGEAPAVAFKTASAQHYNPSRPGTAVAGALAAGEVTGVTPATTYKVVANDSLWKVAKKHGIGVDNLAKANNLKPDSPLKVGQKLIIPGKTPTTSASGGTAGTRTYTVKSGDSIGTIARKQGATVADIRSLNPQIKNDVVRVGQELTLPAAAAAGSAHANTAALAAPVVASAAVNAPAGSIEHIVKPGEGLGQIAKKYGVPQREIAVLNNIADPLSLKAGQKLVIPGVKTPSAAAPAITLPEEQAPVAPSESPVAPAPAVEAAPVAPSDAPAPPVVKVEESAPISAAK
jgi:LysM repeat protein